MLLWNGKKKKERKLLRLEKELILAEEISKVEDGKIVVLTAKFQKTVKTNSVKFKKAKQKDTDRGFSGTCFYCKKVTRKTARSMQKRRK